MTEPMTREQAAELLNALATGGDEPRATRYVFQVACSMGADALTAVDRLTARVAELERDRDAALAREAELSVCLFELLALADETACRGDDWRRALFDAGVLARKLAAGQPAATGGDTDG